MIATAATSKASGRREGVVCDLRGALERMAARAGRGRRSPGADADAALAFALARVADRSRRARLAAHSCSMTASSEHLGPHRERGRLAYRAATAGEPNPWPAPRASPAAAKARTKTRRRRRESFIRGRRGPRLPPPRPGPKTRCRGRSVSPEAGAEGLARPAGTRTETHRRGRRRAGAACSRPRHARPRHRAPATPRVTR